MGAMDQVNTGKAFLPVGINLTLLTHTHGRQESTTARHNPHPTPLTLTFLLQRVDSEALNSTGTSPCFNLGLCTREVHSH